MYFSYAFLDAERTRGIPADKNVIDEVQDMNYDFLQIIHETLSGSPWGLKQYAGTPKSLDNTMEKLWQDSSQAEWMIQVPHPGCGHWNVPALDWDLYDMIGPWHRDISEKCPGVVCAKCRKPLNPRTGRWVHAYPERRWTFAGYHVPQIIMPMHYADHEKWDVAGRQDAGAQQHHPDHVPQRGLRRVVRRRVQAGHRDRPQERRRPAVAAKAAEAKKHLKKYVRRVLAVDWGGGGGGQGSAAQEGRRAAAAADQLHHPGRPGHAPTARSTCIWGHRSVRTHDWEYEARLCVEAMTLFKCSHIVHDYSERRRGPAGAPVPGRPPAHEHHQHALPGRRPQHHELPRGHRRPPARLVLGGQGPVLVTTCMCIKYGLVRFFQYDYESADNAGLLHDFLALIEEKVDTRLGSDVYVIVRNPNARRLRPLRQHRLLRPVVDDQEVAERGRGGQVQDRSA
jgi:hypothetical protein